LSRLQLFGFEKCKAIADVVIFPNSCDCNFILGQFGWNPASIKMPESTEITQIREKEIIKTCLDGVLVTDYYYYHV